LPGHKKCPRFDAAFTNTEEKRCKIQAALRTHLSEVLAVNFWSLSMKTESQGFARVLNPIFLLLIAALPPICVGAAHAGAEKVLHSFVILSHGASPTANLIADAAGNLYGTTEGGGRYGAGTVFKLTPSTNGKWRESVLYSFKGYPLLGNNDGWQPTAGLIFDAAGNLYGTTEFGGGSPNCNGDGCGTVFKLSPGLDGTWTESVLYSFQGSSDGAAPHGGVVWDPAGNLYGATPSGGNAQDFGVVFKLTPATHGQWTETIIHTFAGGTDGEDPVAGLTFDQVGNLYGVTYGGGNNNGTVFELTSASNDTWRYSVLHAFDGTDGSGPLGSLILDSAGNLYGTTVSGGSGAACYLGCGVVFEITAGSGGDRTYKALYAFKGELDGAGPAAGLVFDETGTLYGTTEYGGTASIDQSGYGTVFKLTPGSGDKWTEKVIERFGLLPEKEGTFPLASLMLDHTGNLYGTTLQGAPGGFGTVFKLAPASGGDWVASVVDDFGLHTEGYQPGATVVSDSSGTLYGTTPFGGTGYCNGYGISGCGTVFKLTQNEGGKQSTIHNFDYSSNAGNGAFPQSSLIIDTAGNLYGTTAFGGNSKLACNNSTFRPGGCGTVFKLTTDSKGNWKETVLYKFSAGLDGAAPMTGLTPDAQGNLYGTTSAGGGNCSASQHGCGTVFELMPKAGGGWSEKILYAFQGGSDGLDPDIPLIFDRAGNLYGATNGGGTGQSTVFRLAPNSVGGWTEMVLYSYANDAPSGLILDSRGNLYGTTSGNYSYGTVFELTPNSKGTWTQTVLYTFLGPPSDGDSPTGMVFDPAGNLYGTTLYGGPDCSPSYTGCGTIFKLAPGRNNTWNESVLHSFHGKDGLYPNGPLILDTNGNLFGTTAGGGGSITINDLGGTTKLNDSGNSKPPRLPPGGGTVFEYVP
jgi:uncharacterized repeat protein (TIGR03803 family)